MSRIDGRKKKKQTSGFLHVGSGNTTQFNFKAWPEEHFQISMHITYCDWVMGTISWNFILELNWNYLKRIFLHSLFKGYTLWKVYQFSFSFSFLKVKKYINFHYSSIWIIITLCSNPLNLLPISITYQKIKGMSYSFYFLLYIYIYKSNSFITLVLNTSIHIFISYSY